MSWMFQPRSYQMELFRALRAGKRRAICVWHRRAGKDLAALNWLVAEATRVPGVYYFVFPTYSQGKRILWLGKDDEGRPFLDYIPKALVADRHETELRLTLRCLDGMSQSILQIIGTDSTDSLVGTNVRGCVFSEYSLQDPTAWDLARPILRANGGWAIFLFTPRGRNHAHKLWEATAGSDEWYRDLRTVEDTRRDAPGETGEPVIRPEDIEEERRSGMPEDLVQQEFFCSFSGTRQGSYYSHLLAIAESESRIGSWPRLAELPVHTAWDIGISDDTAIIFFQQQGDTIRIFDYEENSGLSLEDWARVLERKGYIFGTHYLPHDIRDREFISGKTRLQVFRQLIRGHVHVVPKLALETGIDAARRIMHRVLFDRAGASRLIDAISSYHREWDPRSMTFSERPEHDWSSHGADAFRTLALGVRSRPPSAAAGQARTHFDPMAAAEISFDPMEVQL